MLSLNSAAIRLPALAWNGGTGSGTELAWPKRAWPGDRTITDRMMSESNFMRYIAKGKAYTPSIRRYFKAGVAA